MKKNKTKSILKIIIALLLFIVIEIFLFALLDSHSIILNFFLLMIALIYWFIKMKSKRARMLLIACTSTVIVTIIFSIYDSHIWHKKVEYRKFKTDYQMIVGIVLKEFEETDGERLSILYESPSTLFNLSNDPSTKISLTKEEQKSLENIGTISFYTGDGYRFEYISVYDGFVTFKSLNGSQMLVYSYEGENVRKKYPKDDYFKYYFKKASKNWYYLSIRSR